MQKSFEDLLTQAKIVSENAYAPYSNFKVGAAALFETGNIYTEYAWINNTWEQLGDTQITLEYLTNGEIDTIWNAAS